MRTFPLVCKCGPIPNRPHIDDWEADYSDEWDAFYCAKCNMWLEPRCGCTKESDCYFKCWNRPERPK